MNEKLLDFAKKLAGVQQPTAVRCEEGSSLVEMALSCLILIPMLFGIIQLSMAMYCYHYAADAAREATRWAVVRGANCASYFNNAYCSPTDSTGTGADGGDINAYVKSLGYPYSANVTTATKWCAVSGSGTASWPTCTSTQSNSTGNLVQVTVSYSFPLVVPFLRNNNVTVSSVSSMPIVQ